jgi:serine O-acetyltransferase
LLTASGQPVEGVEGSSCSTFRPSPPAKEERDLASLLPEVVRELQAQKDRLATTVRRTYQGHLMPSRTEISRLMDLLRSVIFPGFYGSRDITEESLPFHMGATLDQAATILVDEIQRGLCFACEQGWIERQPKRCSAEARRITAAFLADLPELRRLLALDAVAAYEGDPACVGPAEAIFCYPGVQALTAHRIAHSLETRGTPLIPRGSSPRRPTPEPASTFTRGPPSASAASSTTAPALSSARPASSATMCASTRASPSGAKSFPLDDEGKPIKGIARHPIIEDRVTIYSGATILGRVTIGEGSVIGGNVWLTRSAPPHSRIAQARAVPEKFENGGGI